MRKVGIIGLGHVGVTVAYTLLTKGCVDELVIMDTKACLEKAEYYDFLDALAILPHYTKVKKGSYADMKEMDIIVTTFGDIRLSVEGNNRFGELELNAKNAKEVGLQLKEHGFQGILLNIANPCDVICGLLQHYSGLPQAQVIGTGTSLDTARMKRALAMHFQQDAHNVQGFVLGEHGDSQFVAWSTVSLSQRPLQAWEENLDLAQLEKETKNGAWLIVQGKGYTSYGIASCAVEIIEAIFSDSHKQLVISTYLDAYQTYVGYPALVGKTGLSQIVPLTLTTKEEEKLAQSASMIREKTHLYL